MFTVQAKTNVRILTLDLEFFIEKIKKRFSAASFSAIDGLEQAIFRAEDIINRKDGYSCVPICDYKIMFRDNQDEPYFKELRFRGKLKRRVWKNKHRFRLAVRRLIMLMKPCKQSQNHLVKLLR